LSPWSHPVSLQRRPAALVTSAATVLALLVAAILAAPASAHTLTVRDEGRLHFVHSSGSSLFDEGPISGTIRGHVRVRFTYAGEPRVAAALTIYAASGSITVHASGRLSSPTSTAPSFRGKLTIVSGTGRYAHARGSGELSGVFYRRNYAMVVQAVGKLSY
jgi:hypothetical protein